MNKKNEYDVKHAPQSPFFRRRFCADSLNVSWAKVGKFFIYRQNANFTVTLKIILMCTKITNATLAILMKCSRFVGHIIHIMRLAVNNIQRLKFGYQSSKVNGNHNFTTIAITTASTMFMTHQPLEV